MVFVFIFLAREFAKRGHTWNRKDLCRDGQKERGRTWLVIIYSCHYHWLVGQLSIREHGRAATHSGLRIGDRSRLCCFNPWGFIFSSAGAIWLSRSYYSFCKSRYSPTND